MIREAPEVAVARIEAKQARAKLMEAANRLQVRLSPGNLAQNAWQGAKEKGADLAENAVDAVRKRPIAATGVVAAIALFLAREPLMDLAAKVTDGVKRKAPGKPQSTKTRTRTRTRTQSTENAA